MNILKAYILICLLCPIFNYQEEQPETETINEVAFWCDCGVEEHWKTKPLTKL